VGALESSDGDASAEGGSVKATKPTRVVDDGEC
jgi:hypothetical protein